MFICTAAQDDSSQFVQQQVVEHQFIAPTEALRTESPAPQTGDECEDECPEDSEKALTKTLTGNETILFLPIEEEFDALGGSCLEYLAVPLVVHDSNTLDKLSVVVQSLDIPDTAGFWVSISGFEPPRFSASCKKVSDRQDRVVCFKNYLAFHHAHPQCVIAPLSAGELVLNTNEAECPAQDFRPICRNGLACGDTTFGLCGTWVGDCPVHGDCVEDGDGDDGGWDESDYYDGGGDGFLPVDICRYPPPRMRMIENGRASNSFNVSCHIGDDCAENSIAEYDGLLPSYSVTYYKDGSFLTAFDSIGYLKVSVSDIDSEFQCRFTIGSFSSNKSSVSRPIVLSDKTAVRIGGSVTVSCRDPGTFHLSGDSVSFEWTTPTSESFFTGDRTLHNVAFGERDVGRYACRSVVDSVRSVWSKPLELTITWDDPVLTVTNIEPVYGSHVTLTCSVNDPESYHYTFLKDSTFVNSDRTSHLFHIFSFAAENVGSYYCTIERHGVVLGKSNTVRVFAKVSAKPVLQPVLLSPMGEVFREGQEVHLICQVVDTFGGRVVYSFIFDRHTDNAVIVHDEGTQPDLTISSFSADDEGTYGCFYTVTEDGAASSTRTSDVSNQIALRMVSAVLQTSTTTVPEGRDIDLVCTVRNYAGSVGKFLWLKGDHHRVLLTTAENTVTVRNFQPGNGGTYRCQAVLSDPRLRDPPLVSLPLDLVYAPRFQKCPCVCTNLTLSIPAASPEVIAESALAIQKNLSVSRAGLSSSVRRVSSAPDGRRSSESAGYIAVALLSLVTGLVLVPDVVSAVLFLTKAKGKEKRRSKAKRKMKRSDQQPVSDSNV
ncbi:hypothetical protein EGW08_021282 [Elysia chlorotica]|uniref:Ig-like domain-containing protein n=1 Tax=Elysia chlorotica TaxID=188477 RepID=A0A3S0Z774_ELYCH|nr:hypothetical protein EGW08_021282 [Elysia chlorotica]